MPDFHQIKTFGGALAPPAPPSPTPLLLTILRCTTVKAYSMWYQLLHINSSHFHTIYTPVSFIKIILTASEESGLLCYDYIKLAALFVFIKSTKPNLNYPVCKAHLLDVTFIFPRCCCACGTNQVNMLSMSNMASIYSYTISHSLLNTVKYHVLFLNILTMKGLVSMYSF